MTPAHPATLLKLHFIVLLWGFTAPIGKWVTLPAIELTFHRCWVAVVVLAWLQRNDWRVAPRRAAAMLATGGILGVHWMLFYGAVQISNVSVCLVGIATVSLWTALLIPLMIAGRTLRGVDVLFGSLVVAAVAFIFWGEFQYAAGLAMAITAAMLGAVFTVLNERFVNQTSHRVIALYELAGAWLICTAALPLVEFWRPGGVQIAPTATDWLAILVLGIVFTVYTYNEYIGLLKTLGSFTVNFANTLEPVYGIALGAVFFGDHQSLSWRFYVGAIAIAGLVVGHTGWARRPRRGRAVLT